MAIVTSVPKYEQVFGAIQSHYSDHLKKRTAHYLSREKAGLINPIDNLFNRHKLFFGPNVCNICIIQKPYGKKKVEDQWIIEWPPEGLNDALAAIKESYNEWVSTETHFWGDGYLLQLVKDASPSDSPDVFGNLMRSVFAFIDSMCLDMKDYGFTYHGTIDNEPTPDIFYQVLDKFYLK